MHQHTFQEKMPEIYKLPTESNNKANLLTVTV